MNNWEVKEPLPEEERRGTVYMDDPYGRSSAYDMPFAAGAARYSTKY